MLADLNRLKVFFHIYQHKSVVRAAERLNLTQPAISQQLQKLEGELKVQLFTRLHKRLVPTATADRLYRLVEPFIVQLEEELPYLRQPYERPCGLLRIGAPREFGKVYLPRFCSSFRRSYPEVNFELKFSESVPLLEMMKEGLLDFALVDIYFDRRDMGGFSDIFSSDPLLTERLLLACSRDYYDTHIRGDHSLANLVGKDYINDEDDLAILRFWFRNHFGKVPESLNIVMTLDNHEALLSGIKLGMGLGIATGHLVWEEMRKGEVVPITTAKQTMVNTISLVQLQDKVPTMTEKVFRDFILAEVQKKEIQERFRSVE
jgi:DNA-binding transcriptional LysR family regulator